MTHAHICAVTRTQMYARSADWDVIEFVSAEILSHRRCVRVS